MRSGDCLARFKRDAMRDFESLSPTFAPMPRHRPFLFSLRRPAYRAGRGKTGIRHGAQPNRRRRLGCARRMRCRRSLFPESSPIPAAVRRLDPVLHSMDSSRTESLAPETLYLSPHYPTRGFLAVATIPAARSFAIRLMSFSGTGLVRGKRTVPFRSSYPLSSPASSAKNVPDAANSE